jgi:predicted aspartyl protease
VAATHGQLDSQGCPLIRVAIFLEDRPTAAKEFNALIDTGFTGFGQIPTEEATAIGLVPIGEMPLTYQDGATYPVPVAWASVRLGSETKEGFIFLADRGADILLGVHSLRVFAKTLVLSVATGRVELV